VLSLAYVVAMMGQGGKGGSEFLVMMLLIIAVMYFLIFRPQAKKQKQQRMMLEQLKKGDKIVSAGGIYGTIVGVKEHTIIVKIADNVKIELNRSSVAKIIASDT
jgi:preprotein translocase subunit YajC